MAFSKSGVLKTILGIGFILAFFFTINPPTRTVLGVYLFLFVVSYLVYIARLSIKPYEISLKHFGRAFIFSGLIGGAFYILTKVVPGMSFGLPLLPNAISDSLKFFVVVVIAPIVEEIFFRGALLAYLRNTIAKKSIWWAILLQALAFSLFHLGAYIAGWYTLPNFTVGLSAVSANLSAFMAAMVFGTFAGWYVSRDGIKNLVYSILLHAVVNLIVFTSLVVVFG